MTVGFSAVAEFTLFVVVCDVKDKQQLKMSDVRETAVAADVAGPSSRMIIQQCSSATLEVRAAGAEFIQVFIRITG